MKSYKKYFPFVALWATCSMLLYMATMVSPDNFVLGNANKSVVMAAVWAGLVWNSIVYFSMSFAEKFNLKVKGALMNFAFYLLANFVALWVVARMAFVLGFGVTSFIWLILLALFADLVQYGVWQASAKLAK